MGQKTGRKELLEKTFNTNVGKVGESWLPRLISLCAGERQQNMHTNPRMKITDSDNQTIKELADLLVERKKEKIRFIGDFKVSGKSQMPERYSLVIELMAVTRDGKTTKIVNTQNVKLANSSGIAVGKPDSGKIKMIIL